MAKPKGGDSKPKDKGSENVTAETVDAAEEAQVVEETLGEDSVVRDILDRLMQDMLVFNGQFQKLRVRNPDPRRTRRMKKSLQLRLVGYGDEIASLNKEREESSE